MRCDTTYPTTQQKKRKTPPLMHTSLLPYRSKTRVSFIFLHLASGFHFPPLASLLEMFCRLSWVQRMLSMFAEECKTHILPPSLSHHLSISLFPRLKLQTKRFKRWAAHYSIRAAPRSAPSDYSAYSAPDSPSAVSAVQSPVSSSPSRRSGRRISFRLDRGSRRGGCAGVWRVVGLSVFAGVWLVYVM